MTATDTARRAACALAGGGDTGDILQSAAARHLSELAQLVEEVAAAEGFQLWGATAGEIAAVLLSDAAMVATCVERRSSARVPRGT